MNSRTVRHQLFALALVTALSVLDGGGIFWEVTSATLVTIMAWFVLNRWYCHRLGGRSISQERAREDRDAFVGVLAVGASAVVQLAELALRVLGVTWTFTSLLPSWLHVSLQAILGGAAILLAAVCVSSLVDRYVILPWRNGIVEPYPFERRSPAATAARDVAKRKIYTRIWIIHRLLATAVSGIAIFAMVAIIVREATIALFVMADPSAALAPAIAIGAAAVGAILSDYWKEAPASIRMTFGNFRISVGDYLQVKNVSDGSPGVGLVWETSTDHGYVLLWPGGSYQPIRLSKANRLSPYTKAPPTENEACERVVQTITSYQDRSLSFIDTVTPRADWNVAAPSMLAIGRRVEGPRRGDQVPEEFSGSLPPEVSAPPAPAASDGGPPAEREDAHSDPAS